jgi:RNAse (barnase) inhibitor barstar
MTQSSDSAAGQLPTHVVRSMRGLDRSQVCAWAKRGGQRVIEVDFAGCVDRPAVLRAIAQAFALPSWFGMNLDALYDSLTELLEQSPAEGYVVLLDRLPRSAQFDTEQRAALLDVFRDVVETFADARIPFRVLYS